MVGLADLGERGIGELSTGQFQRVLFARLIMQDANVLLLDEPFNAIDDDTTAALIAIILRWHAEGRTVICVLHDLEQIRSHFPQCLLLAKHCVAWGDSKTVLSAENLAAAGMKRHA